jgi:RNA polymerase sigma-70 factor (ECF subfamily)
MKALAARDSDALTSLVTEDVGFWGDGGGKVVTAKRPLFGREPVVNFLIGIHRIAAAQGLLSSARLSIVDVNFEPALAIHVDGRLDSIYSLELEDASIKNIRVIRNPDKLAFIDRQMFGSRPS